MRRAFLCTLFLAVLDGCFANRASTDKLLDAAQEHNGAVRFGRMDVALDHVATASKSDWLARRAAWKNSVRIIDVELEGMNLQSMTEANVHVRVSWQHIDEADVRSTEITQKWRVNTPGWQLVNEDITGGDTTLLSDKEKPKEQDKPKETP